MRSVPRACYPADRCLWNMILKGRLMVLLNKLFSLKGYFWKLKGRERSYLDARGGVARDPECEVGSDRRWTPTVQVAYYKTIC